MSKPYLSPRQQVQHLISRKGLIIRDVAYAERKLTDIEYTSLIGGYKTPFINPMTRMYEGSTSFEDVLELYLFDKELRLLTFAILNTVEEKNTTVDIRCLLQPFWRTAKCVPGSDELSSREEKRTHNQQPDQQASPQSSE